MKETYLAYFDFMGFKEFIQNNEDEVLKRRMGHIFRDIEFALGLGKRKKQLSGVVLADVSLSKINCLNISDTVIFWTNECTMDLLEELLNVAYEFNRQVNGINFPVRGSILKGKIREVSGKEDNLVGGSYSVQCIYGKGIVEAHLKAENQNWAGTVIDSTIVYDLMEYNNLKFIEKLALEYHVPYKSGTIEKEYVFRLKTGITNSIHLNNVLKNIDDLFAADNKNTNIEGVKLKIENTKKFIIDTKDFI
jgi:hypothetical protein